MPENPPQAPPLPGTVRHWAIVLGDWRELQRLRATALGHQLPLELRDDTCFFRTGASSQRMPKTADQCARNTGTAKCAKSTAS